MRSTRRDESCLALPHPHTGYGNHAQEWLALLSEIPGIEYMSKNFEIVGNAQVLKVICYLLGIPVVVTYRELAEKISTDKRVVLLDHTKDYSESLLETDAITLKIESNNNVIEIGTAYFNWQHSFFKFCKTSSDSYKAKLSQDIYGSLLVKDGTEYSALRYSDSTTMSLGHVKKYVDSLTPVQLRDFLYTDFLSLKRLDLVAYIFEKAVKIVPGFNKNAFVAFALQSVDEPVAEFLLTQNKAPIDIFYKTILKETYLHNACKNKKLSKSFMKKIIAQYPQSIHLKDASNITPLLLALRAKNYAVADFLLEQGSEFAVFTIDGDRLWSSCVPWEM